MTSASDTQQHTLTPDPVPADAPFRDPHLPIEQRIDDLLARMTLPEKVGQMLQLDAQGDIADLVLNKHVGSILHTSPETMLRAVELVGQTRLQIPLLTGDDAIHGHSFWPGATIFPSQLGMACSWDTDLLRRAARVTAVEVAATGIHWTFSPVICIGRELRWGRVDETFGEDPLLLGELGTAMVEGYQGDGLDDPTAILACAKHFAGYSETQGGRDASEADLSRRKLRSWFLPPFERVARAGCRTFMIGYQSMDGIPITANSWLLNDVLKGEWGWTGTLITDWDNVGRMVWEQKVCPDITHAAARAVKAGNDLVMTTPSFFEGAQDAVARGMLDESDLDAALRRILRLKFELGLFENPRVPDAERQRAVVGCEKHRATNLDVARAGLVLLRNEGVLPLLDPLGSPTATGSGADPGSAGEGSGSDSLSERSGSVPGSLSEGSGSVSGSLSERSSSVPGSLSERSESKGVADATATDRRPRTIALIGPNADDVDNQLGDWAGASGQVDWMRENGHPRECTETVLDGLAALLPEGWRLVHARGAEIGTLVPSDQTFPDGQPMPPVFESVEPDQRQLDEAVAAARGADVAVVVVGDNVALTGEGKSTATLELRGGQNALLDAVAATGTPMVVVVISGKPQVLPQSALEADALLWAFNPGMRGGRAIAEVLLGLVEPSGRLPISVPRHVGQQPVYYNQIRGQHGDRYADLTQDPAFVFGEGMGYSTVEYSDLEVLTPEVGVHDTVRARVRVANTGRRPVRELVQVYVSDVVTSYTWADRELKAFQHVDLAPGESRVVEVEVPASACTIVDSEARRIVEPGEFELLVGPQSRRSHLMKGTFHIG